MRWRKLGLIVAPGQSWWMQGGVGATFTQLVNADLLRIYTTGRDANNVSRIGVVDVGTADMRSIVGLSDVPVLDVGHLGAFDENGVGYPWLVQDGDRTLMYYAGWISGGLGGFINAPGLAISRDGGRFERWSRAPLLGRTDAEPIAAGSLCVLKESDQWHMWYTSFDRWERRNTGFRHFYCIKYASSLNGMDWHRAGIRAIDFGNEGEYAIGKPCVRREGNIWKMWYCYRGESYRIGYAQSRDGIHWERMDSQAGVEPSPSGWDSEMVEYAHVFDVGGSTFMTYNGNGYGRSGVGLAVLE